MSQETHVESLRNKHAELSVLIDKEANSPSSRDEQIRKLKRKKLIIKEEIESCSVAA